MVNREKQIWHCFGCSMGGDIFEFIEKVENVDFTEALQLLARKANIELKPQDRQESGKRARLLELVEATDNFWHDQLLKSPIAAGAREYLKNRGIDSETAKIFHLGYSPDGWDVTFKHLQNKGFTAEEILAVGLIVKNVKGSIYDKFRDRIMFPITDIHGRTIGFGGRILKNNADEPKYMNSPQSVVYNKSFVLYNLYRAKTAIKEQGYALLVEGYMDVIGCWQAGINNVVATSGTALTQEQLKLLKRYTKELRLAFDADLAGQSASERGIDLALQAELEVKVIALPKGEDPDTWARKQPENFKQMIQDAKPIGDYTMDIILQSVDINSREGKKQAGQKIITAISKLPDPIEKDFYLKKASKEFGIDELSLRERLATQGVIKPKFRLTVDENKAAIAEPLDLHRLLSERLLSIAIRFSEHFDYFVSKLDTNMLHPSEAAELYRRMLVYYTERKQLDLEAFKLELATEEALIRTLDRLWLQAERDFIDLGTEDMRQELDTLFVALKKYSLSRELKLLSETIRIVESSGNQTELVQLLERFNDLSRQLVNIY